MKHPCFPFALAAVALHSFGALMAQEPAPAPVAPSVDDTARFIAGLPPVSDPLLIELAGERAWQRHSALLSTAWSEVEAGRLAKVRQWALAHVPAATAAGTVFYMFSGPDFLYADAIYPEATTYVFCGIEPVGPIPDIGGLRRDQLAGELQALRASLDSILNFSFFITKEMKQDLRNHALRGTLPVLSLFIARAGKTICDVGFVGLDRQGALVPVSEPVRAGAVTAPGVRITFRAPGSDTLRTLYYFSTDISNSGLESTGFLAFCRTLAPGNSLVKSASYLMHESYFSSVRSFLLENTATLVQDDSGIPCAFLPPEQWELRLFGSYPGPIPLFHNYTQPRLADLYRRMDPVPLDFGIGYRHRRGESTLIVAIRRPDNWTDGAPRAVPVAIPVAEAEAMAPPPVTQ